MLDDDINLLINLHGPCYILHVQIVLAHKYMFSLIVDVRVYDACDGLAHRVLNSMKTLCYSSFNSMMMEQLSSRIWFDLLLEWFSSLKRPKTS